MHFYLLLTAFRRFLTHKRAVVLCVSACGRMNQVCQDNEGMQAGESSYDFEEEPKTSLLVTASLRGEGPPHNSVRLVPKTFSFEVKR